MKAALLVLALTGGPALAAPEPLKLQPLERVDEPATQPDATLEECSDELPGRVVAARHVVGTTTAFVLHDCGMDAMTQVAMQTPGGWFLAFSTTLAYHAANMTEFPLRITPVAERISTGLLADGARAIVQTVETQVKEEKVSRALVVQVCSVDANPACGFLRTSCPKKACPSLVRLSRGTLIIGTERRRVVR